MTVAAAGGLATGADIGPAVGGSFQVRLRDPLELEIRGTYAERGRGVDTMNLGASLLASLGPTAEPVVPYVAVGGGVYHVRYDLDAPRFLGPIAGQLGPGSQVCPAPGSGSGLGPGPGFGAGSAECPAGTPRYWGVGELPEFYARRLGPLTVPAALQWGRHEFTDPALNLGGGVRISLTDRIELRPDARMFVVFGGGSTRTFATLTVGVGYGF